MKAIRQLILTAAFVLMAAVGYSQVTGTVTDGEGMPLPGASVQVKGTKNGTTTDFDGKFTVNASAAGTLVISYVGFTTQEVPFTSTTQNVGTVSLMPDAEQLEGVVVIGKGVIDLEEDRKTPIAVSTVTAAEIQAKAVGNVEFPEVIKNTPSVYVSNQSGGFGDSQMFLRGFDQRNTAFLLNGQPINGMEDGRMYWSNWAGLSDVANAVQVQRGLGSSKLAISSVGGTVNIVTKATDLKEGGFARLMTGNDSYMKGTIAYNTGISEKGWGFSMMIDHWQGARKYAEFTRGQGQNYFFSVGKIAGDHKFNFLLIGAPQWHDQNYTKSQATYDEYGIKYNNNGGFKDGEYLTSRRNYYHKPVMNLNWDWTISEKSNLSTVAYASFGRGGGTGTYGKSLGSIGAYNDNGYIDWDTVQDYNSTIAGGASSSSAGGSMLRSSVNNHAWYGMVTNFEHETNFGLTINVGADIRFYKGDHFREITDFLGLTSRTETFRGQSRVVTETFNPDPWAALFNYADENQRVNYDYSENLNYQGAFGQAEYVINDFSVFVQAAVSNQSYKREDRTNFEEIKTSDVVNKTGYNLKGGTAYAITENHKIFANAGLYSRQPFLDNVFPSYSDYTAQSDPEVDNEKITGFEAGYSFANSVFSLNLNGYYTTWKNRFLDASGQLPDGTATRIIYTNIAEVHKGLELDMKYKPTMGLMLRGYSTYGEWRYDGSSPFRVVNTDDNTLVTSGDVELTGTRVGQAPQFSAGLGAKYDIILNTLSVDADWNYFDSFYGFVDTGDVAEASLAGVEYQPEKLNGYGLVDMGATYNFPIGNDKLSVRANVYNIFGREYVSQQDSYGVLYGAGTTWNFSVKYSF